MKRRIIMTKKGFTLVEMLIVIAIVGITGTILVTIFANTLRGSNKSQILAVIKQNGQSVMENMDKEIKGADNIICPKIVPPAASAASDTLVIVKKGAYIRYKFIPPGAGANGLIKQDSPALPAPPAAQSDIDVFLNSVCSDPQEPLTAVILTDTNTQTGVSVGSGMFIRNQKSGFKDTIDISFTLQPGRDIPSAISDQIESVSFRTTLQLR